MPLDHHPKPGSGQGSRADQVIAGRYRLGDELGHGGFGVVYAATDELLRREVAVKEIRLPASISIDERAILRQRVLREARSAGRLHHPGLVSVFDVLDADDHPWIVMELVDGPSLGNVIRDEGPLPREQVARIGISLAYALEAAHRSGVVHRDVKPANVLISTDGRARLTDFGIALSVGDPTLTRTGVLLGSPSYIAPERARGGAGGPGSDIWALGATLFTAIEGGAPYESDSAIATLTAIVDGRRHPFRLAGSLAPILDDLMAVNPSARPSLAQARQRLRDVGERETHRRILGSRANRTGREHPGKASVQDAAAAGSSTAAAGAASPARNPVAAAERPRTNRPDTEAPDISMAEVTDDQPTMVPGPAATGPAEETQPQDVATAPPPRMAPSLPAVPVRTAGKAHEPVPPARPASQIPDPAGSAGSRPDPESLPTRPASPRTNGTADTGGSPGDDGRAGRNPPNRRRTLMVGIFMALVVGAAIGIAAVLTSGSDHAAGRTGSATTPGSASPSAGAPTATSTAVTADPGLVPLDTTAVTPPAGWQSHVGPSGWSIAYPQRWSLRPAGGTERIDFLNPETGAYLRIDTAAAANPSALADWQAHEAGFRTTVSNYQRVKIEASDGGAGAIQADWEFTYTSGGRTVHVLNRGVVRNGHGYALYWSTPDSRWPTDLSLMWQLFSTFRPGR